MIKQTRNAAMKEYRRILLWLVVIGLALLQTMVTNVIYLHPYFVNIGVTNVIYLYPYFENIGVQHRATKEQQSRRAASITMIGSERNQQLRKQEISNDTNTISTNTNITFLERNASNFAEQWNYKSHVEVAKAGIYYSGMNDVLYPIFKAGKMYSICRADRSGSVIADMIYAHAFAYAHNITYAGSCCVRGDLPKVDTKNLLHSLHWNKIMPFSCPSGVNNKKYNLSKPNATSIHELLLNPEMYRLHGNQSAFTPAWRQSIHKALYKYTDHRKNRPYNIAVHVRRGDVTPCRYKRRYLPNSHYLALIDQYTPNATVLKGRPLQVTIYSESDTFEPFDVFKERNYRVELDTEDLAQVWHALSTADVAILSRSFFSIVPAAINPNIVVATDFIQFDVRVMDGWEFANPNLVQTSTKIILQMSRTQCNGTVSKSI